LGAGLADSQTELEDHSMGFRWPCTTPGAIGPFLCCPFLVFVVLCWLWLGGGLTCAPALVSSPRRIELNRMFQVMYGAPPTLLSFTLAGILSKRLEDYAFAAARAPWCPSLFVFFWLEGACACQHGLRPGLQRSLIVIAPLALVLGLRGTPRRAPSHPVVLAGSMNSTSRRPILPPSECSVLWFFFWVAGVRHSPPPCCFLWRHLSAEFVLPPPPCRLRTFNRSKHLLRSLPRYYRAGWHRSLAQIVLAVCCRAFSFLLFPALLAGMGWTPINPLGRGPLDSFRTCC